MQGKDIFCPTMDDTMKKYDLPEEARENAAETLGAAENFIFGLMMGMLGS